MFGLNSPLSICEVFFFDNLINSCKHVFEVLMSIITNVHLSNFPADFLRFVHHCFHFFRRPCTSVLDFATC